MFETLINSHCFMHGSSQKAPKTEFRTWNGKNLQTELDDEEKKRSECEKKSENITKYHIRNRPSYKV